MGACVHIVKSIDIHTWIQLVHIVKELRGHKTCMGRRPVGVNFKGPEESFSAQLDTTCSVLYHSFLSWKKSARHEHMDQSQDTQIEASRKTSRNVDVELFAT